MPDVMPSPSSLSHSPRLISRAFLSICLFVAFCGFTATAQAHEVEHNGLIIDHPALRAPLAGQSMSVGYMSIANKGPADRLIGAKADFAAKIEIHTHTMDDGIMRMRKVDGTDIGHKQVVRFETGGLHLMIFGVNRPLIAGSYEPVTLIFEIAGEVKADFAVEALVTTGQDKPHEAHGGQKKSHH